MKHIKLVVIHHFKYMAVAVYHQFHTAVAQKRLKASRITAGVTAYVCQPYFHALYGELLDLTTYTAHLTVIYISCHGTHHRRHILKPLKYSYVTDIAGVPYLVTSGEIPRITVIPVAMCV
jgi:hypothetical protein